MTLTHVQIATAIALICGYAAAHAAALLTHANAPEWVLGLVNTVLSALAGVLPTVAWAQDARWTTYVANVFVALFATTMAHKSDLPVQVTQRKLSPRLGIGSSATRYTTDRTAA